MRRIAVFVALTFLLGSASGAWAQTGSEATPALTPGADATPILQKMIEHNAGLRTYRTRVILKAHMLNFPFLTQRLSGTSYFSAPDRYEVVFDRVPSYAKNFSRVFDDVGDPARWEKEQNITVEGTEVVDGSPAIVLRLTKKIHSTQTDHALAFVDAKTYMLERMEWFYTNGGTIAMTQHYRNENGYDVLASQHADVHIPFIHAVADAEYGPYDMNVAIEIPPAPER
jgi:outer membrane lipoprotein-sorting protein